MKKLFQNFVLWYLKNLAGAYVKRQKLEIVGLTGSVGKTSLTIATHAVLSKKFDTAMTFQQGHGLNSETGIPFALLGVHIEGYSPLDWVVYLLTALWNFFFRKCPHNVYVLELGVDKPDDMEFLLSIVQPRVGIFLSLASVHAANFEELARSKKLEVNGENLLKLIFEEKAKLITNLPENGVAILNRDDETIYELKDETKAEVVTFGLEEADIQGTVKQLTSDEFVAEIAFKDQRFTFKTKKYILNKRMLQTFLAAFAVGIVYEIDPKEIVSALEQVDLPPGRMTKIEGIKDTVIIDSSYNASTPAVLEALDNLALFKDRTKIAVLGDMRELGVAEKKEHEIIARRAVQVADKLVVIGPAMEKYFMPEALKNNFSKDNIKHFDNTWKALDFIKNGLLEGGEAVLVKGSQNTLFTEIIVEGLMRHPEKAEELLCRRGEFWERKRQELKK